MHQRAGRKRNSQEERKNRDSEGHTCCKGPLSRVFAEAACSDLRRCCPLACSDRHRCCGLACQRRALPAGSSVAFQVSALLAPLAAHGRVCTNAWAGSCALSRRHRSMQRRCDCATTGSWPADCGRWLLLRPQQCRRGAALLP